MIPSLLEKHLSARMVWIFRLLLGLVFLYASIGKILDPQLFAADLMAYRIIDSPQLIKYLAVTLPWMEWFCGTFLVVGVFVRSVSLLASLLMLIFILGMSSALVRGLEINCGCFGTAREMIGPLSLLRDSLFFVMSLAILFSRIDAFTLQTLVTHRKPHKV